MAIQKKAGGAKPPSAAPVAAGLPEVDAEVRDQRRRARRKSLAYTALWVSLYYGFGMAYYGSRARKADDSGEMVHWTPVDSIYFATVTMTTTGYGDLKPHDTETRYVTLLYLLVGMLVTFPAIGMALAPYYMRIEYVLYQVMERLLRKVKLGETKMVDIDGDGLADYEEPPAAFVYYLKGVSSWLLLWICSQLLFAVGYIYVDPDGEWDFETAFYVCIVTASTVGYGDVGVSDNAGPKLYASAHILYSVSSLAALLNTITDLYTERRVMLRKGMLLQRQLDLDLIQSLDKDNNGLDKLEFIVGMLTKLEILQWDDVEPFLAQFDALDKDGSGRLDKNDLVRMVEEKQKKLLDVAKLANNKKVLQTLDRAGLAPTAASPPATSTSGAPSTNGELVANAPCAKLLTSFRAGMAQEALTKAPDAVTPVETLNGNGMRDRKSVV